MIGEHGKEYMEMSKLYPAIWTSYYRELSPEEAILALKKGGFAYGELSIEHGDMLMARGTDYEKTGLAFKAFLDENGFSIPQGHLDFVGDLTNPEFLEKLKNEIVLYRAIGIKHGVIHLNGADGEVQVVRREKNLKALRELQGFVRGTDFILCIENLNSIHTAWDADGILGIIEELGGDNLGICLDTGHLRRGQYMAYFSQTHGEFIRKAGSYLKALHINCNNGMSDQHMAPYAIRGSLDYYEVLEALYEIGFEGLFNFEVDGEVTGNIPRSIMDLKLVYLKDLADMMVDPGFVKK